MSLWAAVKSAIAILAAATEAGPPMSEYRLDMSVKTPIFTVTCACAVPHASAALNAARPNRRFIAFLLVFSPETGADLQFPPETGADLRFSPETGALFKLPDSRAAFPRWRPVPN